MDMKKIALVVLVAAVCMTAVMAAGKEQPKPTVIKPDSKSGAPAPAPDAAKGSDDPVAAKGSEGPAPTGSITGAPAPAPASSANTVVGSLAGASLVSFLALYM